MVDTNKLRGIIVAHGYTQQDMAKKLGIAPKTFYEKMKKGVFGTDEASILIQELDINNPADVFFANRATSQDTKETV